MSSQPARFEEAINATRASLAMTNAELARQKAKEAKSTAEIASLNATLKVQAARVRRTQSTVYAGSAAHFGAILSKLSDLEHPAQESNPPGHDVGIDGDDNDGSALKSAIQELRELLWGIDVRDISILSEAADLVLYKMTTPQKIAARQHLDDSIELLFPNTPLGTFIEIASMYILLPV